LKNKRRQNDEEQLQRRFYYWLRRGTQALQQGDVKEALRLLDSAYRLDPENLDAALNLGGACILSKKFKQAVSILEPLSERAPENPMVWTNLGAAYLGNPVLARDEDQQRAIAAFERALEIDPQAPNVAYNLGLVYRDRQDRTGALRWFRQAVDTDPNDRDAISYIVQLTVGDRP
jgi:tetratricopeptide (TPR) repeat protein